MQAKPPKSQDGIRYHTLLPRAAEEMPVVYDTPSVIFVMAAEAD